MVLNHSLIGLKNTINNCHLIDVFLPLIFLNEVYREKHILDIIINFVSIIFYIFVSN